MIYLIQSKGIDLKKNRIVNLLKIGYTSDYEKTYKNRFSAYKLHNPLSEILYIIPRGTLEDESKLHHKFRLLVYPGYGREWFLYDDTIINFFKTYTTKEELDIVLKNEHLSKFDEFNESDIRGYSKKIINRWLCKTNCNDFNKEKEYFLEVCSQFRKNIFTKDDVIAYLEKQYSIDPDILDDMKRFGDGEIDNNYNISEFLDNFESLPNFYYKMKSICESHLSDIELGVVLDQIPLTYKQYYEVLGKDRCKALGYKKDKYEKYISDLKFNRENLANDIYLTFEVGKRYTRSDIKSTLQNLYKSLGYNKTPKANDLEEYFNIKDILITVSGKREHGFEIINKKEKKEIVN